MELSGATLFFLIITIIPTADREDMGPEFRLGNINTELATASSNLADCELAQNVMRPLLNLKGEGDLAIASACIELPIEVAKARGVPVWGEDL